MKGHRSQYSMEFIDLETVGISFDDDDNGSSGSVSSCDDFALADETEESDILLKILEEKAEIGDMKNKELLTNCGVFEFQDDGEATTNKPEMKISQEKTKCCDNLCNLRIWPVEVQLRLKAVIANKSKSEIKQTLLDHLHSQESLGVSTCGFLFGGNYFCRRGFTEVSGVSGYIVREVFKAFVAEQVTFVHGNEVGYRETEATVNFTAWMKRFAHNYGNYSPDEELIVLSSCFSLKDIYYIYSSESPAPHIKKSYFYKLFKVKFGPKRLDKTYPRIRLSMYTKHSVCDQCLLLDKYKRSCKGETELGFAKSLEQAHRRDYVRARLAIEEFRLFALSDPDSCVCLQVDDMDNSVGYTFLSSGVLIIFKFIS